MKVIYDLIIFTYIIGYAIYTLRHLAPHTDIYISTSVTTGLGHPDYIRVIWVTFCLGQSGFGHTYMPDPNKISYYVH